MNIASTPPMQSVSAAALAELPPTLRKTKRPKPNHWQSEIERVLITEEEIALRVRWLTRKLQSDFAGRDLVIVSLLNGTVMFLADLVRHLSLPLRLDFIGVSSYGAGT